MSGYRFQRSTAEIEVAEWGELQRALHRWVLAHGGSSLLAQVAAWASLADAQADAALALRGEDAGRQGAPPLDAADIDALRREPLVGDGCGDAPTAFVIDADARFYLWRNFARERGIARRLASRLAQAEAAQAGDDDLAALFDAAASGDDCAQRDAVQRLSARRFAVLTGGPGTGKTTAVLRMLLMAQRHRHAQGLPPARIAIAAPTGKAAQRLLQALRNGRRILQSRFAAPGREGWRDLLDALPDAEALTLHRLLGYRPHDGRFARGAATPLDADIVVVDEASMLDLALLDALLAALRPDAQLFLVGDADQLTSIGTGSVLLDLVAALDSSEALVRLQHGFRAQGAQLPRLLEAVRRGDAAAFDDAFDGDMAIRHRVATSAQLDARLRDWTAQLAALPALHGADPLAALDALATRQLLCALREGPFGARHANAVIERALRRHWRQPADARWYPGRAVMVARNDYAAGLFNGDAGICLADADGSLRVWFEAAPDADGQRRVRAFAPAALPEHESAFAITVHKSQGSEYGRVALLLPPEPQHRILSRQLLYTGLSRARQAVEAWGDDAALAAALSTPIRRIGGLRDALAGPG